MAVERHIQMNSGRLDNQESMKDLLKQLAEDGEELLRQELDLAKIEMRESLSAYAADTARIGIAVVVAGLAGLSLTAFLIIALGRLVFSNNYWLSALIVGVVLLAIGAVML